MNDPYLWSIHISPYKMKDKNHNYCNILLLVGNMEVVASERLHNLGSFLEAVIPQTLYDTQRTKVEWYDKMMPLRILSIHYNTYE